VTLNLAILGVCAVAVIVFTVIIRLWRLHGGYDNLPGDVLWGGVTMLAVYGLAARNAYRLEAAGACVVVTGVLCLGALLIVRRRSRRRGSLSRYYSN